MRRKWYVFLILTAVLAASTIAISFGNKDTAPGQNRECSNDNQCSDGQVCVDGSCKSPEGSCSTTEQVQDESALENPESSPGQNMETEQQSAEVQDESTPGNSANPDSPAAQASEITTTPEDERGFGEDDEAGFSEVGHQIAGWGQEGVGELVQGVSPLAPGHNKICNSYADCPGQQLCCDGICQQCCGDVDCPDGEYCNAGVCGSEFLGRGYGCLPPGYGCDYGYECCSYYCSGGSNGVCYVNTDCRGYDTGDQVCCDGICQSTCEPGSNSGSSGIYAGFCAIVGNP